MSVEQVTSPARRSRLAELEFLREEGRTLSEVAKEAGISRSYASAILGDPDGLKERARKDRYGGTCEKCGGKTNGSAGPGKAAKVCITCITAGTVPKPPRKRPYRQMPRWDYDSCLAAVLSWVERNEKLPRGQDFADPTRGPGLPCTATVYRYLGRRPERIGPELAAREAALRANPDSGNWWWAGKPRWADVLLTIAPHVKPELLIAHRNMTMRRELMEAYGFDRMMLALGTLVHQDDWGKLWSLEMPMRKWEAALRPVEPVVMVEVVNSTPEPDGSFKDYFLRVPPDTETARAGVAWTFGYSEEEYALEVET